MATLNFDSSKVEPRAPMEALPKGWYGAEITSEEMKATKDDKGAFLQIEYTIFDHPSYKGRKAFGRLNLQNANPQAVEIAQRDLSSLCRATGLTFLRDSAELRGKRLMIRLKVRAGDAQYEDSNDIVDYKPLNAVAATVPVGQVATASPFGGAATTTAQAAASAAPGAAPAAAAPAASAAPWGKKA